MSSITEFFPAKLAVYFFLPYLYHIISVTFIWLMEAGSMLGRKKIENKDWVIWITSKYYPICLVNWIPNFSLTSCYKIIHSFLLLCNFSVVPTKGCQLECLSVLLWFNLAFCIPVTYQEKSIPHVFTASLVNRLNIIDTSE